MLVSAVERECDLSQHVGQLVEREGCLVRHDSGPLGPQPGSNQILLCAWWVMGNAIDPPLHAKHAPRVRVMHQELR